MPVITPEKSKVLLFGKESVFGTAVALTSANAILTKNFSDNIGEGDVTTDEFDGIDTRNSAESSGNLRNSFSFDLPLTSSLTVNKTPPYSDILQACGFSVVTVAGTSATYTHAPLASLSSGTIEMRRPKDAINDHLFKTKGARGILGCDFKVGQRPMLTVRNMQGDYIQPVLAAKISGIDLSPQIAALFATLNKLSVVKFTLNGKAFCATSFSSDNLSGLNLSRGETFCDSFNEAETTTPVANIQFLGTDWASATELNPFEIGRTDDQVRIYPFEMEIGTIAGKKFSIICPSVQPTKPSSASVGKSYGNGLALRFLDGLQLKFF